MFAGGREKVHLGTNGLMISISYIYITDLSNRRLYWSRYMYNFDEGSFQIDTLWAN